MSRLFGDTRTRIGSNHALIAPDGHVSSPPLGWDEAEAVVLISPALGGSGGGPRFVQSLIRATGQSRTTTASTGVERLIYVLTGAGLLDGAPLRQDDFVWFPPDDSYELTFDSGAELLLFERTYEPLAGILPPKRVVGSLSDAATEPFQGDPGAMLTTLLPVEAAFDMAVNVFNFQPGATLPLVETHVMEHGLYMRQGQGVYRLGDQWHPVRQGDAIWMASFCPQWFAAIGKEPASYIYYKDIHRDPLLATRSLAGASG